MRQIAEPQRWRLRSPCFVIFVTLVTFVLKPWAVCGAPNQRHYGFEALNWIWLRISAVRGSSSFPTGNLLTLRM